MNANSIRSLGQTFVTPITRLLMSDRMVRRHAMCLRPPAQTARVTLFLLLSFSSWMSMLMCRTFFLSVPRGPVTVTRRDLISTVTPSGISSSSVWTTSRICGRKMSARVRYPTSPPPIHRLLFDFCANFCSRTYSRTTARQSDAREGARDGVLALGWSLLEGTVRRYS